MDMGSQKGWTTGRKTQMMEASGDLERIFRQREQNSDDEETAALFLISISRTKESRIRVEVDASVDEEAVRRLVDDEKVQLMRLQRREQQQRLQAVPFDDGYRIKQRRALSAAVDADRKKTLSKQGQLKKQDDKKGKVKVTEVSAKDRLLRKAKSEKATSDSKLANQKLREQEASTSSQLPDFAKPFIKLRDVVPNPDWMRPAPPRFHGLHMYTKCFENRRQGLGPRRCEKVPVFHKYLRQVERLEDAGGLSQHLRRRSQLYDGMCQELMHLENTHVAQPRVYAPLKDNCYECQRYHGAVHGVFFKTSHADFERDAVRAPLPLRTTRR